MLSIDLQTFTCMFYNLELCLPIGQNSPALQLQSESKMFFSTLSSFLKAVCARVSRLFMAGSVYVMYERGKV